MKPKVAVVMPAFNAARTLQQTWSELPTSVVDHVIVVDDHSSDETVRIAQELGIRIYLHDKNYGYGANQKTCYTIALDTDAEIIVMVHPDYQYDPRLIPEIIEPILDDRADVVLGSRLLGSSPVASGMPQWKYMANRALTKVENIVFGLSLSEFHTGYRAYRRGALELVNYRMNSDAFVFDQEIIAQFVLLGLRIAEISVPTRYLAQSSSASFLQSTRYGLEILVLLLRFLLHRRGIIKHRAFESLLRRYADASLAKQ